jgi:4-amino-4-deoxy-L-arabinose transferase-like glycosyltransferase
MKLYYKYKSRFNAIAEVAVWLIIGLGIVLRLILFFQNRNLIIDEANIVRNLVERDFAGLLLPLKYEQYAPPIFLWMEELASLLFGYGEKAMRLYPLLCGIASLFVFRSVAKLLMPVRSIWLPMALMACTYLLIKYSVELKQYMPDTLITLLLVWFALRKDIFTLNKGRFMLFWMVAGSIAVWASMPSVFSLAAVGFYYTWQSMAEKKWDLFKVLIPIAIIWFVQFGIYYLVILKPQIESDYLQNYHRDYFLFATPATRGEWEHNYYRIKEILNNIGGYHKYSYFLTVLFIGIGSITLIAKRFKVFILIVTPLVLTIIAAMLDQFSLIDRVILFLMPIGLLLLGYGFDQFWRIKFLPFKAVLIFVGLFMLKNYNMFWLFHDKLKFHELTEGFDYLNNRNINGEQLFVHDASVPTYLYYTNIHPDREKYSSLLGAHLMKWDSDFTTETDSVKEKVYFIYTGGFPDGEREKRTKQIEQNMQQVDYYEKYICYVYGYIPKEKSPIQ